MSFLLCCKECTLLVINNFFFPLKDLFKCQGPSNKTQQVSKCEKKKKTQLRGQWGKVDLSWIFMRFEGSLAAIFERLCAVEKSMQQEMVERKEEKNPANSILSRSRSKCQCRRHTMAKALCDSQNSQHSLCLTLASPTHPSLRQQFWAKRFFFFFFLSEVVLSRKASKHRHLFTGRGSLQHFTCPFQFTTCLTSAE